MSRQDSGVWTDIPSSDSSTTSYTVPNLSEQTSYTFYIRLDAETPNTIGSSDEVSVSSTTTDGTAPNLVTINATAPHAPEGLVAVPTPTSVMLAWVPPFNGGSPITGYQIRQDSGVWTDIPSSDSSTTSYTVPNLSEQTSYTFYIRAVNTIGSSDEVSVSSTTTDGTAPNLASVPTLTTTGTEGYAKAGDTLTLTFTVSEELQSTPTVTLAGENATVSNTGTTYTAITTVTSTTTEGAVTYDIGTLIDTASNSYDPAVMSHTIIVDRTAPVITLTGSASVTLDAGDTYTEEGATADTGETVTVTGTVDTDTPGDYTITYTATDAAGNTGTASRTVTINATAPHAPEGLVAVPTPTSVMLAWVPPFNGGSPITGYQFRQDSGVWTDIPSSDSSTTSYTVPNLSEQTSYTFYIRAVNTMRLPEKMRVSVSSGYHRQCYRPQPCLSTHPHHHRY